MKRTVLVYGLIAGAVLSLMLMVTLPFQEAIGFDTGAVIGYTTMVAAFLLIFFGVKSYRDSVGGGAVSPSFNNQQQQHRTTSRAYVYECTRPM